MALRMDRVTCYLVGVTQAMHQLSANVIGDHIPLIIDTLITYKHVLHYHAVHPHSFLHFRLDYVDPLITLRRASVIFRRRRRL
jgi:hypothetical protein